MFEDGAAAATAAAAAQKWAALARIDAVEEKMRAVTSKEAAEWRCVQCARAFLKAPLSCAAEGHTVEKSTVRLFSFGCECGQRVMIKAPMCALPCAKCGSRTKWSAASIFSVRDKVDAGGAGILPRGEEQVNSLRGGR
jgi:hypothetical protein